MLLNIITGGIGSGKSDYLYSLISENLKNNPGSRAVVIVPEQFSYTAEKTLAKKMGGLGINGIEVLTFSRLMHRYIPSNTNVEPSGKMMLISKAAGKTKEDNLYFASSKRHGFITSLSELFSEFKRYMISPLDMENISVKNDNTKQKLMSLCEIYKTYTESFTENMTDSDDALGVFAEFISKTDTFDNTFFFIDDYNDFMPGHYAVIRQLIAHSRGVFVTLSIGDKDEAGFFAPVHKTKKRLSAIALAENAQLYTKDLGQNIGSIESKEIVHLLENWEEKQTYPEKTEDISIFTARDLYSEVEHTASEIISLVRDKGYRFRDIGVICGNMESYLHILNAVFADYNIPFFTDEKLAVNMHPIAKTVLSLFDVLEENFSYISIFDYLRGGYIYEKTEKGVKPLNQEDIDFLENYVLKYGIKGKKAWFEPFTKCSDTVFDEIIENHHAPDFNLEKLNALREKIIAPFVKFLENKSHTVRSIATGVYEFMKDLNLYEGIMAECTALDEAGFCDEAEQFRQVWNALIGALDQIVLTMGGDIISRENFSAYFKNGLSACSISIIPSGLDRVSLGTVARNSPSKVKVLFIIGASFGAIPLVPSSSGILSELDRSLINEALSENEKELAPGDLDRIILENIKLYRIVSTASEKLYVSYPASDSEGNAINPSSFIEDLKGIFPKIKKQDNVISKPDDSELLASSKRGFYYMLLKLSEYYQEKPDKIWASVYDWYEKNPEYKHKLDMLKVAAEYKKRQPMLSLEKAQLLYGKDRKYSITALEKYSKCPFSYYVERGLHAEVQESATIETSHIGSIIHTALDLFCAEVEKDTKSVAEIKQAWEKLTDKKTNEIIDKIIVDMAKKVLPKTESDRKQIEYLLERCRRTLKKSAETVRMSLSKGGYVTVCREKKFQVEIDWKNSNITLIGAIDRIDIIEDIMSKKAGIRIIDYKSGSKTFSISAICNKIDMQLVLYAVAAVKMYKKGEIEKTDTSLSPQVKAILYNKINDNFVAVDEPNAETAGTLQKNERKLDGVTILDTNAETGEYILDDLYDMDASLETSKESDFLKVKFKADGVSLNSSSQVTERGTFDLLCDYMKKTAVDTHRDIMSGKITIRPVGGDAGPCKYCDYKEICMFDELPSSYRKIIKNKDEALEIVRKEMESDEQN